jgi:hypothetical protein
MPAALEGGVGFLAASVAITAWVLTALALTLAPSGGPRAALLFLVGAGIPANNLLEAVFFSLDIPRALLAPLFLHTVASAALFAIVLDRLAGRAPAPAPVWAPRAAGSWGLRLAATDVSYIVLYFTAGLLVFPYVSHFYEGRGLPSPGAVLAMQVVRGLVFASIVLVLARFLTLPRAGAAVLIAVTLSLLGGVAPLLVPNPFMPTSIRYPHMIEVAVSNFLFALAAAALLRPPLAPRAAPARAAA